MNWNMKEKCTTLREYFVSSFSIWSLATGNKSCSVVVAAVCVCVCVVHDVRASLPGSLIRHLKSVLQPDRQNKTENIYRKCNFVYVQSMEKQYGDEWRKHYDDVLLNL